MPDLGRWPAEFREELEQAILDIERGPDPVAAMRRLAALYFANDLTSEAEQALRTVHRRDPTDPRTAYFLAVLLSRRNDHAEAERFFRETLALAPEYSAAQFQLGQILANSGRDAEAREFYERRLGDQPGDVLATLGLVDIDRRQGNPDAAAERLRRLLQLEPATAEARLLLAEILESQGLNAEAAEHRLAAQAIAVATPTNDPWLDEVYLQSFDPFRLQTLGVLRSNAGAIDEALPYQRRAASLAPNDGEVQDSFALALIRAGRTEEARSLLETTLKQTNAVIIYLRLADLLGEQGRFDESESLLRRAFGAEPGSADLHDALGRVHLRARKFEEAVSAFREALRIRPTMTESQLNLGRSLHALGHRDDAREAITRALTMRPGWIEASLALAELELDSRRWIEAESIANQVLASAPRSSAATDLLARIALGRAAVALAAADILEAEKIYRTARERLPSHGPLHGAHAALLGKLGRLPEAENIAERYTEIAPNDARAWFLLGTIREQRGNTSRANEAFAQGLVLARETGDTRRAPLLEQALDRLNN